MESLVGSSANASCFWLSDEFAEELLNSETCEARFRQITGSVHLPLVQTLSPDELFPQRQEWYPKTTMDWEFVYLGQMISQQSISPGSSYMCHYSGPSQNGMRHGFGRISYGDGKIHCSGRFFNNELYGLGEVTVNGIVYYGQIKNGRPFGEGLLSDLAGRVYAVSLKTWDFVSAYESRQLIRPEAVAFRQSLQEKELPLPQPFSPWLPLPSVYETELNESNVIYKYIHLQLGWSVTYQGEMLYNFLGQSPVPHGNGKLIFPDGSIYQGKMSLGRCHGEGRLDYANGWVYQGMFANDMLHGDGKWFFNDRLIYEGSFRQGLPDGRGERIFPDGSSYLGEFVDGESNGHGMVFPGEGSPSEDRRNDLMS